MNTEAVFMNTASMYTYQGAVALTVGSVPRRTVPELRHFHCWLKMNNQSNLRTFLRQKIVLRGTDPTVSATAPSITA